MYVDHSADDLNEMLNDSLMKWQRQRSKMSAIITDNASNNKEGFQRLHLDTMLWTQPRPRRAQDSRVGGSGFRPR